jgi:transposase
MKRYSKLTKEQRLELQNAVALGKDVKEVRRAQSILLLNDEYDYLTIEDITQFKERAVLVFRQRYLRDGLKGIIHKRKGSPKRLLNREQRAEIIKILKETSPKDNGYSAAFWTTTILAHMIKEKYGVEYKTKRPFYLLFEDAKFTFHKPGKVYEKRDEEKVKIWKNEVTPIIKEAFDNPNTVILCEDEMILSSQTTFQKIWLKKGEYPKIEVSNTKVNRSIYGFLNMKIGRCHSFVRERQNMLITTEILKEIRFLYPGKKILLIWDGAGWHRGSVVQDFVKEDNNIQIVYFPPYSPEENPQEHVWKKARSMVTHNTFISDIKDAAMMFSEFLNVSHFPYKLRDFTARS